MTKRMLADLLWDAANNFLLEDSGYSCFAVDLAAHSAGLKSGPNTEYDRFLRALGCETGTVMKEFQQGKERQGVRYVWLLLAMHVADDERIEVTA